MGKAYAWARRGWKQWKPDEAREVLTQWKKSGLPLATFARQQGFSKTRLRWWRARLSEWNTPAEATESRLVPAVVTHVPSAAAVVVHVPSGVSIEVADAAMVPPQWLAGARL